MEQRRRIPTDTYQRVIETYREVMSDLEMEIFLGLVEGEKKTDLAHKLDLTTYELREIIRRYLPPEHSEGRGERLTKAGRPYKQRLSRAALLAIVLEKEGLSDEERRVLRVIAESTNLVLAAAVLGKGFEELEDEYRNIRRVHDF